MKDTINDIIEREIPKLPGWCTPEKAKRLTELAGNVELAVELGVFGGRSLAAIALGIKWGPRPEHGYVDGIDPYTPAAALEGKNDPANDAWWKDLDYELVARAAQEGLYRLGLTPYAHLVRMRSHEVVCFYEDSSVDLLHQDSNHSEEISCLEVELWAQKIRSGGIWVIDDTDWSTTKKAQGRLVELGFEELEDHERWKVYKKP